MSEPAAVAASEDAPLALVRGEPYTRMPQDLYIPPDALEVLLEAFEGPLDLLLYLIKRHNLDILDIPIAEITRQYVAYLAIMQHMQLELAAEYLVMAATLAEIKSRMLLPRPGADDNEEDDPRTELIKRLQEYERFKKAAENLDTMPRLERDLFICSAQPVASEDGQPLPSVELNDLLKALKQVLDQAELFDHHHVRREALSVRERMSTILQSLDSSEFTDFNRLFTPAEGRLGIVVTLLAVLELVKETLIELVQVESFAPIYVRLPE